jgi:hypothetical protein
MALQAAGGTQLGYIALLRRWQVDGTKSLLKRTFIITSIESRAEISCLTELRASELFGYFCGLKGHESIAQALAGL